MLFRSHSESPTTINLNYSSLPPLRDLNNTSSSANPSQAKSEASTSPRSQAGFLRSPLRTSFDNEQDTPTFSDSSLAVNSTQSFPNVLLENARTKTQVAVTNQPTKDDSVKDQSIHQSEFLRLRTSFDNVQDTSTSINSSLAVNSTQSFSNVLLENARTKTQDTVTNQLTKDESVKDQNMHPNEAEMSQTLQAKNIPRDDTLNPVTAVETTGDVAIDSKYSSEQRNNTITAASSWKSPVNPSASSRFVGRLSPTRSGLGRKPSGARAQLTSRSYVI